MSNGKAAGIGLLLLIGGGFGVAVLSSRDASAKSGPNPNPNPKRDDPPAPPRPDGRPTQPASDPKDPLPILPTASGDLPNVPYRLGLVASVDPDKVPAGTQGATMDQCSDFVSKYEVDPAAIENWIYGGPDTSMGAGARGTAWESQLVAKIKLVIGAQNGSNAAVANQLLKPPGDGASGYLNFQPNGYWPDFVYGLPMYVANADDKLPRPDDGLSDRELAAWSYFMCDCLDLATLQHAMTDYDTRALRKCAQGIATKLRAQLLVRSKYGFGTGGAIVNIPAKYGGMPEMNTAPSGGGGDKVSDIVEPLDGGAAPAGAPMRSVFAATRGRRYRRAG